MKTLVVLLLLALALGAGHWTAQRPGEGVEAFVREARLTAVRAGEEARGMAGPLLERVRAALPADAPATPDADVDAIVASVPADELPPALDGEPDAAAPAELGGALPSPDGTPGPIDPVDPDVVEVLGSRVAALENELTRTMTASESSVVQSRLDETERRLVASERRLEESLAEIGPARLDTLDARLEELDLRLDDAGAAVAATATRVPALDAASSGDAGSDTSLDAGLDALDRRLASLESRSRGAADESRRREALDDRLSGLADRLEALVERDVRREAAMAALEATVEELTAARDALSIDAVQGEVRAELRSLAAEVGSDAAAEGGGTAELVTALETMRARVAELEERVRELPASSPAADGAQQTQSALESQILALGKRIETLPEAPDAALVDGLDDVRERVRELSSQGFVTQEELRAQAAGRNVEYKIYFDKNSTSISDEAATVLDSFIAQETNRTAGVSIFGFTDTKGSANYNQQLAQSRAANVRSYLIRNGFDYAKIDNVAGLGEDAAAAILGDEQEDAGQRVVVLFAAQL